MAFEATLRHGNPCQIDYTPSGADVAAGQVIVYGDLIAVAHLAIEDGEKGAVAIGGGVYRVTAAAAIGVGKRVYWDNSANKVTTTASTHKVFGYTVSASGADGDPIDVLHLTHTDNDTA